MSVKNPFRSSRRSIKLDRVDAKDLLHHDVRFSCEDCSHFNSSSSNCTLGFETAPHRKQEQARSHLLTGHMAFCRFLEID